MPKLKVIPTPTQARILKAMSEVEGLRLYWTKGSSQVLWAGIGHAREIEVRERYGQPRASSVKRMLFEGWLERPPDREVGPRGYLDLTEEGRSVLSTLTEEHFVSRPKLQITAVEVIAALRKLHPFPEWIFAEEVLVPYSLGAELARQGEFVRSGGRLDAFAFNTRGSRQFRRVGYEVKVTRQDFLRELEHPRKRTGAMAITNLFYFAAPAGLVKRKEVPKGCGLIEIDGVNAPRIELRAPWRDTEALTWPLMASVCRSLVRGSMNGTPQEEDL